jgi:ferredoxin-type protein NapH
MASMAKGVGKRVPFTAKLARWRLWIQAAFLAAWLDPLALRMHTVCAPVFHCYSCPLATFACPIGVLAQFGVVHVFPFIALGTLVIFGALLGSFICGWICPFGLLQDLVARIPTRKFQPPVWMTHFRYVVLVGLVLALPYFFGKDNNPLFFCRLCPAGAVEAALPVTVSSAFSGGGTVWPGPVKLVILVLFLGSMLFVWRPWCTLFCPLGAIFSLFNRTSFLFLRFHPSRCSDCRLCSKLCHYGGHSERRAGNLQCIRCMDCTRCGAVTLSHVFSPSKETEEPAPQTADLS